METRVEACQRQHSGSFKRAHIGSLAGAITAAGILLISKLTNCPSDRLTWSTVAYLPVAIYAIVFGAMVWTFAREMKQSRVLDDVDRESFGSVQPQS